MQRKWRLEVRGSKFRSVKSRSARRAVPAFCLAMVCCTIVTVNQASGKQVGSGQNAAPPVTGSVADKSSQQSAKPAPDAASAATPGPANGLVIEPNELPVTFPHTPYRVNLYGRGNYVPVLHWSVQSGTLPPGIKLDDNGMLHGEARHGGDFLFVVMVKDGDKPQQAVQKGFTIHVMEAITVVWKTQARVNANRIEGSVEVSNASADDLDLTYDVKAVAENGRATEIGYQHFPLKKGTVNMLLPFGETLPFGNYLVYVNVVGEVAARHSIYRQRLQTPAPLQVLAGP